MSGRKGEGPDPVDIHVGNRMKGMRLAAGLTQSDLARRLGITFQQVQKYERGVNRVSASMLAKTAAALGCTIASFFPEDGGLAVGDPGPPVVKGSHELSVLFAGLGTERRTLLLQTARQFAAAEKALAKA